MKTEDNYILFRQMSSISAVYSSVLGELKAHLLSKFPSKFFKHIHIKNSSAAIVEPSSEQDESRVLKSNPSLAIGVTYNPTVELKTQFPSVEQRISFKPFLDPFIYDRFSTVFLDQDEGIEIRTDFSRIRMEFEISIRVESELQSWDVSNYIETVFTENRPYYLNKRFISCQLPNTISKFIRNKKGFNPASIEDMAAFKDYMKVHSRGFFNLTRNLSSGSDVVYFEPYANLLLTFQSSPSISKGEVNASLDKSLIELTGTIELNIPKLFAIKTNDSKATEDFKDSIYTSGDTVIASIVTFKVDPPETVGRNNLVTLNKLITQSNEKITEIDLTKIIPEDILSFISNTDEENSSIILWYDTKPVTEQDYTFDRKNKKILLYDTLENLTYHLALYINLDSYRKYTTPHYKAR